MICRCGQHSHGDGPAPATTVNERLYLNGNAGCYYSAQSRMARPALPWEGGCNAIAQKVIWRT